ncbi:MAG: tyrosine--tRNA ligase [Phycisphaeraceae bacterium]|nr:tyrosine--tRNA ligase [Phycisphaerae bacterium]MBX3393586.1 tyrosine--tRNA ligase [Phycisphaeraceae bacterium]HRJ49993.1 tyrosine--tRNA ligase [Phycisphaerales bacterium]
MTVAEKNQRTLDEFIAELDWRGLIHQTTGKKELLARIANDGPWRAYVGFDPTAPSLTIGNLMGIMTLRRFQEAGHQPVVVMGGGTGLIGDPSGKSAERQLLTREAVEANVSAQQRIFDALIDFSKSRPNQGQLHNNVDWLGTLSYLDALRDIGKYFSVNAMIQRDSVRDRLHNRDQGISYTEFSYMILQSYDYYHLWKHEGVRLQMGGSDQWGNIVSGIDLIQRMEAGAARHQERATPGPGDDMPTDERDPGPFGLTWPLVTKSDGTKFGKTESGAIWLTADRTSPYEYYQFWLNTPDADAGKFLRYFTLLEREEIESLERQTAENPAGREAQRRLAREATTLLHGKTEADHAESAAKALFSGEIGHLPEATLRQVLANVPASKRPADRLAGDGVKVLDLLVETGLASSKREAREFLATGSVSFNGKKASADDAVKSSDLLHGRLIALRRGKKNWHLTEWE